MRFFTLLFAYICINIASFILVYPLPGAGPILPVGRELFLSPLDLSNTFNLVVFGILTVGGIVGGIVGVLLRQYVYATGILLIWVIGLLAPIVWWMIAGLPMMLSAVLAPLDLTFLISSIVAFFTIHAFFFMIEISAGRQVT